MPASLIAEMIRSWSANRLWPIVDITTSTCLIVLTRLSWLKRSPYKLKLGRKKRCLEWESRVKKRFISNDLPTRTWLPRCWNGWWAQTWLGLKEWNLEQEHGLGSQPWHLLPQWTCLYNRCLQWLGSCFWLPFFLKRELAKKPNLLEFEWIIQIYIMVATLLL